LMRAGTCGKGTPAAVPSTGLPKDTLALNLLA